MARTAVTDESADPCLSPPEGDWPKGTVQQNSPGSPWWWVRGTNEWHLVNAETAECTCAHFRFRCSFRRGDLCKHLTLVAQQIEEQRACPYCHGRGLLVPRPPIRYVRADGATDDSALNCIMCDGSGKREES